MVAYFSRPATVSVLASTALLLAACASGSQTRDTGQRISARGSNIAGQGAAWTDGQRDVAKGQKRLEKSADRLADAENDLRRAQQQIQQAQADRLAAEQLIASGNARMSSAEAGYADIRGQPSAMDPR